MRLTVTVKNFFYIKTAITVAAAIWLLGSAPAAASPVYLAPHEAAYTLRMTERQPGGALVNINGEMAHKFLDECDGWATTQSFVLHYIFQNGNSVSEEKRFTNWEAKDGSALNFAADTSINGKKTERLRGLATRNADGSGRAVFQIPEDTGFDLTAGTLFPSRYVTELLKHAKAGQKIYNNLWFDGADKNGPVEVNSFVFSPALPATVTAAAYKDNPEIDTELLGGTAWNMRLAFFSPEEKSGLPDLEMEIVLHDNGVVSAATIHFKNFTLTETLGKLQKLEKPDC
ncbi:MAG: DUF1849 family protein [Micavibrio sp.]|nr:MAG: DUF1849 family protein [Micavibrio sp.]